MMSHVYVGVLQQGNPSYCDVNIIELNIPTPSTVILNSTQDCTPYEMVGHTIYNIHLEQGYN